MKRINYVKLFFAVVSALLLAAPASQTYAYSSPYFATRVYENNSWDLSGLQNMQIVAKGNTLYVASPFDGVIYKINNDRTEQLIAGIPHRGGYVPDGSPAVNNTLQSISSIAVANDGTVYIAEGYDHLVRAILPDGTLTTVAGNGNSADASQLTDAPNARQTPFNNPTYIKVGPDDILYVYDSGIIRRILPDGSTDHVAGAYGAAANSNPYIEGGVATQHALMPNVIPDKVPFAFDNEKNLYLTNGDDIYEINNSDGVIHTFSAHSNNPVDTLEDEPVSDAILSTTEGFDIDHRDQIWTGGGSLNVGNAIRYVSPTDHLVRTAGGGGSTSLDPLSHDYTPILGADLELPYGVKSISVSDSGQVYYIAAFSNPNSEPTYYVGMLSTDSIPPVITAAKSPVANQNGWNNTNVTVSYTCSDAQSGVASCSSPTTLSTDGANQSVTGTAADNAGNSGSTTVSGINIDKTPPTATNPTISGWLSLIGATPTITATVSDNLSGVVGGEYYTDTDPGQGNGQSMTYNSSTGKLSAIVTIKNQSSGTHKIYMRAKDAAGNWSTPVYASYYQL